MNYATIDFNTKRKLDLKLTEYCFLVVVDYLAFNAKNKIQWCYASRKTISERIDVSERYVYTLSQRMQDKGLIEIDEETGYIRTTAKWFDALTQPKSKNEQSSEGMNRVQKSMNGVQGGMNRVQENHEQSSYNNNKDNKSNKEINNSIPNVSASAPEVEIKERLKLSDDQFGAVMEFLKKRNPLNKKPEIEEVEAVAAFIKKRDEVFDTWWKLYDKKTGKKTAEKLFAKIDQELWAPILDHSRRYVKANPEKRFRKNPETYLRQEAWNDEIIVRGRGVQSSQPETYEERDKRWENIAMDSHALFLAKQEEERRNNEY